MLLKLVHIEHKKTKKSFAFWLTLFGSVVIPGIVFLVIMIKPEAFVPFSKNGLWLKLMQINFGAISSFLFPMYVIYLIGLMGNIEYKSSNWKKLFVLPIRKELLISGKLLYVLLHVLFAVLLFGVNVLVLGAIAGIFHPEFNMYNFSPHLDVFFWLVYHLFLSVIGIVGVQFLLSIFFENILVTLAIGLFLMVGSLIAAGFHWEYIEYVPYASPNLYNTSLMRITDIVTKSEWVNIVFFAIAFAACLFFFKRKTVK